jgi:uncharacterized protein (DUF1501 family)
VAVKRENLFQDRDYPVLNDYRGVLAGLFQSMFGLTSDDLERVFPSAQAVDLKLI